MRAGGWLGVATLRPAAVTAHGADRAFNAVVSPARVQKSTKTSRIMGGMKAGDTQKGMDMPNR
jgi:hypothetical protein